MKGSVSVSKHKLDCSSAHFVDYYSEYRLDEWRPGDPINSDALQEYLAGKRHSMYMGDEICYTVPRETGVPKVVELKETMVPSRNMKSNSNKCYLIIPPATGDLKQIMKKALPGGEN